MVLGSLLQIWLVVLNSSQWNICPPKVRDFDDYTESKLGTLYFYL